MFLPPQGGTTNKMYRPMTLHIEKNHGPRGGYVLRAECVVPRPLGEVFAFFADAHNLEQLTPAWLKFNLLTPGTIDMHVGTTIDYRLRVRGIPLRWQSEITAWDPPHRFVDEARRSPYRHWHHEHRFEPCAGADGSDQTCVTDLVHYAVPGGPLVHRLFIRRDLEKIFAYRQAVLAKWFSGS